MVGEAVVLTLQVKNLYEDRYNCIGDHNVFF